jgi:hypothetical protein
MRDNRFREYTRTKAVAALLVVAFAAASGGSEGSRAEAQQTFAVTQIAMAFDNGRPDVTVPRNYPDLRASAFVDFQGTGLFQALWVVDDRILGAVTEQVLPDQSLQLASPAQPFLPTFEPGRHTVTLQVRTPQSLVRIPVLTYFVTADEYQPPR